MGSLFERIKDAFFVTEEFEEENYDSEDYDNEQDYDDQPDIKVIKREETEDTASSVLVEKPSRFECKHQDFTPYSFEDMVYVVDTLRAGKAVVLNLNGLETTFCQRVLDFAAGVVCSLRCISDMPTNYVCILIPEGMDANTLL